MLIHDSCDKCIYEYKRKDEEPCNRCKLGHLQPNGYPDLWCEDTQEHNNRKYEDCTCTDFLCEIYGINNSDKCERKTSDKNNQKEETKYEYALVKVFNDNLSILALANDLEVLKPKLKQDFTETLNSFIEKQAKCKRIPYWVKIGELGYPALIHSENIKVKWDIIHIENL